MQDEISEEQKEESKRVCIRDLHKCNATPEEPCFCDCHRS